jgi:fatty acid desaturase
MNKIKKLLNHGVPYMNKHPTKISTTQLPNKLNLFLCLAFFSLNISLFYFAAQINKIEITLILALAFTIIMIPVYSLLHESMHHTLNKDDKTNDILGNLLGAQFIVPLTFIRFTHNGHHRRNRSDYEMFDLYYDKKDRLKRTVSFYFIITSYWIALPLATLFLALMPKALKKRMLLKSVSVKGMIQNIDNKHLPTMRLEAWLIIAYHFSLLYLIGFNLSVYLIFYIIHCLNWSSQNYVNHAYSVRDVKYGAHNHTLPKWAQALYLNFNLHGVHHLNPTLPWNKLSAHIPESETKRSKYFYAWFRIFKGPVQTTEPCPLEER